MLCCNFHTRTLAITVYTCESDCNPRDTVARGQGIGSWQACHEFEPVPLKTHRVGQRCTLNLSRGETSSCWCDGEELGFEKR
ncbi:hypothetical protein TNCV_1868121 [Trichonephila clavipes]|nr:hypothetical protein TNCV_1868121 [Trichonephila clavipes]